jgi:hypothetical protein
MGDREEEDGKVSCSIGLTKKINTSFPFPDRIEAKWEIEKKRTGRKEDGKVGCSMGLTK